jgi:hypothetical protein
MAEILRLYQVTVGPHTTLMRLNDRDASSYGTNAVPVAPAAAATSEPRPRQVDPSGKSRLVTSNKMRGVGDEPATPVAE